MDEELVLHSRSHHAVLDPRIVRAAMSEEEVRTELRRGVIERVHRGVYRIAGSPVTPEQELLAAIYAAGAGGVGSHRSAAAVYGVVERWPDVPEVAVPGTRRPRLKGVIVHRSTDLCDALVTVVRGIPVTGIELTLLDLGSVCGPRIVERALERATVGGLTTIDAVAALHQRLRRSGRNGAGVLDVVLGDLGLRCDDVDSSLEHAMARLFARYQLPSPVFHYRVCDEHGHVLAELDFAYPAAKLAIEVDGFDAHGSPRALQADLARQNVLVALGWTILRFTWNDVTRRPKFVARQISEVLRTLTVT